MSPEVWADARPRIDAVCIANNITCEWPNEDSGDRPNPPDVWVAIELSAEQAETLEMHNIIWEEHGTIWMHVMIPVGTGIERGLTIRKALAVAFRSALNPAVGLSYRDCAFDPAGPNDDDGVYRRLTAIQRYVYQDMTVT